MKYVIWQEDNDHSTMNGFMEKARMERAGWKFQGQPVKQILEFEAHTPAEAREFFDAWDDALPRPHERCNVCDALHAEGHIIPEADTSSPTM